LNFFVRILGSGAALPTSKRAPSSQYICCNNRHILIDCGEGTQMQLRKYGVHMQRISHILISHLHGDHFFGLPGLLSTMNLLGRDKGITVYCPPELPSILEQLLSVGGNKLTFNVEFKVLSFDSKNCIFEDDKIEIWSFPLKHRIPTCGFQVKEKKKPFRIDAKKCDEAGVELHHMPNLLAGKNIHIDGIEHDFRTFTLKPKHSYAYSYCSDTSYDETLIPFIESSDLLYHEATFSSKHKERAKKTFHSTAQQAATIAQKSGVKKLILGHFSSRYAEVDELLEEAKQIFPATDGAEDGAVYDLAQ
jgi:ribonuclease Z